MAIVAALPQLSLEVVITVEAILQTVGGLLFVVLVGRWIRGGWRRDPLREPPVPPGPPLAVAAAVVVAYVLTMSFIAPLAAAPASPAGPEAGARSSVPLPGSAAWHRLQLVDDMVRSLLAVAMAFVMVAAGREAAGAGGDPRPRPKTLGRAAPAVAIGLFVALPLVTVLLKAGEIVWMLLIPDEPAPVHHVLQALHQSAWGLGGVVQLAVTAVLVAPVAEELFFRGLILGGVARLTGLKWAAVLVSAVLFGLVHTAQPQDALPLTVLGLILGFLRVRYQSLLPCVVLHALFNGRTMTYAVLCPEAIRAL